MMRLMSSWNPAARRARVGLVAITVAALAMVSGPVAARTGAPARAERRFTVMTQNLYLGANLQPLFGTSGPALVEAAARAYAHVVQTDFPSRAQAIAREIAEEGPAVVGLQEVSLWQTAPIAHPEQMETTYDFLALLLEALEDRGAPYRAVAVNVNFSGMVPISLTTLASLTDRDAIIARADLPTSALTVSNPVAHNYQAALPVPLGGQIIQVPRGWSTVDVKFRGKSYRFADTHLEAYSEIIRNLQAQELAASLSASPLPVVLVGDINSLPDTGAYAVLEDAGFVDTWTESMDGDPGYTAGQTDDLDNVPSQIDHRIDYIFHNADGYLDGVVGAGDIVGEELSDRTPAGLWPSDHAGVVLTARIALP